MSSRSSEVTIFSTSPVSRGTKGLGVQGCFSGQSLATKPEAIPGVRHTCHFSCNFSQSRTDVWSVCRTSPSLTCYCALQLFTQGAKYHASAKLLQAAECTLGSLLPAGRGRAGQGFPSCGPWWTEINCGQTLTQGRQAEEAKGHMKIFSLSLLFLGEERGGQDL